MSAFSSIGLFEGIEAPYDRRLADYAAEQLERRVAG